LIAAEVVIGPPLDLMETEPEEVIAPLDVTVEHATSKLPPELIVPVFTSVLNVPEAQTKSSPLEDVMAEPIFIEPAVEVKTADLPPEDPVQDWAPLIKTF
jgi:hypothetical protein